MTLTSVCNALGQFALADMKLGMKSRALGRAAEGDSQQARQRAGNICYLREFGPANGIGGEKAMIDINTASADEIDMVPQLKGHGFEIARYRDERGRFEAVRQLEEVPGLAGKVAGLEDAIRFG